MGGPQTQVKSCLHYFQLHLSPTYQQVFTKYRWKVMQKTPVGVFCITFNLHLSSTCLKSQQIGLHIQLLKTGLTVINGKELTNSLDFYLQVTLIHPYYKGILKAVWFSHNNIYFGIVLCLSGDVMMKPSIL